MEHLISMTDFVLELNSINYPELDNEGMTDEKIGIYLSTLLKIDKYAHFLKKELKLGYFIPCDENDVPLEFIEYECWAKSDEEYNIYMNKYFEAKQRVLFDNIKLIQAIWLSSTFSTIESLRDVSDGLITLKLTETAKKEIGI